MFTLTLKMPLKSLFWRQFKSILIKNEKILTDKFKHFNVKTRYAICNIDNNKKRLGMIEYGMAFYLPFSELRQYLSIIDELSSHDVLMFGFIISKYDAAKDIQLYKKENNEQDFSFILESEDRSGRFNIFDVNANRLITVSFADLLQNTNILKKMGCHELFQIGMIAGKNKKNGNALQAFEC